MSDKGYDEVDASFGIRENRSSYLFRQNSRISSPTPPPSPPEEENTKPHSMRGLKYIRQKSYSQQDLTSMDFIGDQIHATPKWSFLMEQNYRRSSSSEPDTENRSKCPDGWKGSTGFVADEPCVEFGLDDTLLEEENDSLRCGNEKGNEEALDQSTAVEAENASVVLPLLQNERKLSAPNIDTSGRLQTDFKAIKKKSNQRLSVGHQRTSSGSFLKDALHKSAHSTKSSGLPMTASLPHASSNNLAVRGGMGTRVNRSLKDLSRIRSEFDIYKDKLGFLTPGDQNFIRTGSLKVFPKSNPTTPNLSRRDALVSTHSVNLVIPDKRKSSDSFIVKDVSLPLNKENTTESLPKDVTKRESESPESFDSSTKLTADTAANTPTFSEAESVETREFPKPVGCWGTMKRYSALVLPVLSCLLFLADIGTDFRLAWLYYTNGQTDLFLVTLAFILIPSAIMAVVDLSWFSLDRKQRLETLAKHNVANTESKGRLAFRIVIGILSLGRVYRSLVHVYHYAVTLSKKRRSDRDLKFHRHRAVEEKRDYYMLDFINAFAESAPQLLVQLVMWYKYDLDLVVDRVLSLLSSWTSIAWAFAAYYRCNREAQGGGDLSTVGFIFVFCAHSCAYLARFSCIALFSVYFTWIVGIVLGVHFIIMTAWTFYQRPPLNGIADSSCGKGMFKLFFGYVQCISFVNLSDGGHPTRYKMVIFYGIYYLENFAMAASVAWYLRRRAPESEFKKMYNLIALPAGLLLHLFFNFLYYWKLHPPANLNRGNNFSLEELSPLQSNGVKKSQQIDV